MRRPGLLFLSPQPPWPIVGGAAIRTASLLAFLARRFEVDLVLFAELGGPDPAAAQPPGLVRTTKTLWLPKHENTSGAKIRRNFVRLVSSRPPLVDRFSGHDETLLRMFSGSRYRLGVIEHFWCAPYVEVLRGVCSEVWLDLHNVESVWFERLASIEKPIFRPALRRFAALSREMEANLLPRFARVLVPAEQDAEHVATASAAIVYPNALSFIPAPARAEENAIIFTGNLGYLPNVDAVRWFARRVWPEVRRRRPDVVWRIGGMNPEAVARYVAGDRRIELVGPMADAVAEIARAKVAVVPLRTGSGTRLKILEAWAAATPVVSTSLGAEGLGGRDGANLVLAASPTEMIEAILALLGSSDARSSVGSAGRRRYEEQFTWETAWLALEPLLRHRNTGPA